MLYGFLIKMNNSWFQSIIKPDLKGILGKSNTGRRLKGVGLTPPGSFLNTASGFLLANFSDCSRRCSPTLRRRLQPCEHNVPGAVRPGQPDGHRPEPHQGRVPEPRENAQQRERSKSPFGQGLAPETRVMLQSEGTALSPAVSYSPIFGAVIRLRLGTGCPGPELDVASPLLRPVNSSPQQSAFSRLRAEAVGVYRVLHLDRESVEGDPCPDISGSQQGARGEFVQKGEGKNVACLGKKME